MTIDAPHIAKVKCIVVVVGGTGSATFVATGLVNRIMISTIPAMATALSVDITDVDGDEVTGYGDIPVTGLTSVSVDVSEGMCKKTNTLTISGANKDGTYHILIPYKRAFSVDL